MLEIFESGLVTLAALRLSRVSGAGAANQSFFATTFGAAGSSM